MWGGPLLIGNMLVLGKNAVKSSSPTQPQIVAWRGADGQQIWSVDVGPYNGGSATPRLIPSPDPSVLYDRPNSSTIEARSTVDGRLLWVNTQVSGSAYPPQVVQPQVVAGLDAIYAISTDGSVNAFSIASPSAQGGTPLWQFGHHDVFAATLAADTLYVRGHDTTDSLPQLSVVYALDAHTGSVRWAYTVPATHDESSDLVASPNAIVFMNFEGIYALHPADGAVLWHGSPQTTSWSFCPFLTVIRSTSYYLSFQDLPADTLPGPLPGPHPSQMYLSAVDATDGSLYWSVPVGPELTVPPPVHF
jgi:outer membrane protein assembly factor BamB